MVFSGRLALVRKTGFDTGRIIQWVMACLLLLGAGWITAAENISLYESIKPVSGQTEAERKKVIRTSLSTVFVRITGNRSVLSRSTVKEALDNAGRYVRSYYYGRSKAGEEQLEVSFDPAALNSFLRRENIPLWGSVRPTTLMWLAIEEGGKRHIVGSRSHDVLSETLRQQEVERGLSILLPVMDLEDSVNVQVGDVWGLFESPLVQGAARYGAPVVMAGRIYPDNKQYSGRLVLFVQGQRKYFDFKDLGLEQIAIEASDRLASTLSGIYAVVEQGQGGWVAIRVDGINSTKDYAGVLNYLRRLAIVREVGPARAKGSSLILHAKIDGDSSRLANAIALEHALEPVILQPPASQSGMASPSDIDNFGTATNSLHYIWRVKR